jgi:hypothetical protein
MLRWWRTIGSKCHRKAPADDLCPPDGSNGYLVRQWKVELQKLADEIKLPITVACRSAPASGTRSHIIINWRASRCAAIAAIVYLIASTTTNIGLRVRAALNEKLPKGAWPRLISAPTRYTATGTIRSDQTESLKLAQTRVSDGPPASIGR